VIGDLGSPNLPATKWVSLTSALTWLAFDRAVEIAGLSIHAARLSEEDRSKLLQTLSKEWHELADYASDGSIHVRARPELGHVEIGLGAEELRTHRHIGWVDGTLPRLVLDRFPVTFAGAFKSRALELSGGLLNPVISRADVIKYKQVRSRAKQQRYSFAKLRDAEARAIELLAGVQPQTGTRDQLVSTLVGEFAIPKCRAAEIWRKLTPDWPKRGRPKGSKTRQRIVR
jgi:hypothetical protein